jgi:hypothetical protein
MAQKKLYKGQPYQLIIDTDTTLTGADAVAVEYVKPSGITGVWTTGTTSGEKHTVDVAGSTNNEAGDWVFRVRVRFTAGQNWTPGTPACVHVDDYTAVT